MGKLIVKASAGNLKKVMLELGGKSPAILFNDADLSKAIPGAAVGLFINSGQNCCCTSRIYVQRRVYEQVVEGLTVWVNCVLAADQSMPTGGFKQSGWGYERSWKGIDAYLNTKAVYVGI